MRAFRRDLVADRWTAFVEVLPVINADLTDAEFAMQVRLVNDAPGAALVDLVTVTTAAAEGVRVVDVTSDTIANHIAAQRVDGIPGGINPATGLAYQGADEVTVSRIGIRINETTMEGLPFPTTDERGDDAVLAYDLHVTPSGQLKFKLVGGDFTVAAGATQ